MSASCPRSTLSDARMLVQSGFSRKPSRCLAKVDNRRTHCRSSLQVIAAESITSHIPLGRDVQVGRSGNGRIQGSAKMRHLSSRADCPRRPDHSTAKGGASTMCRNRQPEVGTPGRHYDRLRTKVIITSNGGRKISLESGLSSLTRRKVNTQLPCHPAHYVRKRPSSDGFRIINDSRSRSPSKGTLGCRSRCDEFAFQSATRVQPSLSSPNDLKRTAVRGS